MLDTKRQIHLQKRKLKRIYTINLPLSIILGTLFYSKDHLLSFINNKKTIRNFNISDLINEDFIIFFIIIAISFYFIITKKKKEIEILERDLHLEKKNIKPYKSTQQ